MTVRNYDLPIWHDAPAVDSPVSSSNLLKRDVALKDLDERADNGPEDGYGAAGVWERRVYGDLVSNVGRGASSTYALTSTTRTLLILLGLIPANTTISAFRLFVTTAIVTSGTVSAGLFTSSARTNNIWNRVGTAVAPVLTATGLVSTNLSSSFSLGVHQWAMLELVLVGTAPGTYPVFAAGAAGQATLLNPPSGAPVAAVANATTAPGTTLDPTTGFTAAAQKVWCALA